jgi:hypothetical protein
VNFTPPFPAYTSGHATFGGAVFKTLANFYQTDDIRFSIPFDFISDEFNGVSQDIHEAIPELVLDHVRQMRPRHFESFSQAAAENAASRIFLGIHWRFDATEGTRAGNEIADIAFDNLLRPVEDAAPNHIASVDHEAQIDAYLNGTYHDYFQPHDPVLHWNSIALEAMRKDSHRAIPDMKGPTEGSMALGYVHTAIYDAVNAIDGTHTRYVYEGKGARGASMESAVAVAAHTILSKMFPSQKADLDAKLATYLNAVPVTAAEAAGIEVGFRAANRLLGARENDGRDIDMSYTPVNEAGRHQPDPLHPNQGFLSPKWGLIQPFAMQSGDQFRMAAPPSLDSDEYAAAYNEVMVAGAWDAETADRDHNGLPDRTSEQTQIGLFWAYDGSRNLSTPPRLYNQIVQTIARQQNNSVVENARLFALVNIAMADAGIASWETKYAHDFWRPIIGIRQGAMDGNPDTPGDPDWKPLGAPASNSGDPNGDFTPPFPAYTSGHATFGGATFRTLENFYGTDEIAFDFQSDELNGVTMGSDGQVRPAVTRHFDSFSQAMQENAQSRIYLGIHWQFDATEGMAQGKAIADYVFANKFRPRLVFHNDERAADVNGDGELSILDVVVQVQQLRHYNVTGEMEAGFQGFCDTNSDEKFTIGDLLGVVIAMRGGGGETSQSSNKSHSASDSQDESAGGESSSVLQLINPNSNLGQFAAEESDDEIIADETSPGFWEGDATDKEEPGAADDSTDAIIEVSDNGDDPLDPDGASEDGFFTALGGSAIV